MLGIGQGGARAEKRDPRGWKKLASHWVHRLAERVA